MKRFISLLLSAALSAFALIGCATVSGTPGDQTQASHKKEQVMTKTEKEYNAFLSELKDFPVSFVYGDVCYNGLDPKYFRELSRTTEKERNKVCTEIALRLDDTLAVRVESAFYRDYDAYDYTVYFENGGTKDSKVIRNVIAADMSFNGEQPRLKGILGDHGNLFEAYDSDLTAAPVSFVNTSGRPCAETFPYFNLETEKGGALLAIGWGGTWNADFTYSADKKTTRFTGTGTVGLHTYLKPGETVRTPLIGVVRYYERDEDKAMSKWRRWLVDCVYPRDNADTDEVVKPFSTTYHCFDTDNEAKYNTDGSTAEDYTSWEKSVGEMFAHGLNYDVQWVDAGWYLDPYGKTVPTDWWGTVGTWELDNVKWPGNSFRERVDYAHEHGQKFLVWFEPERVTHLDGMVASYGYDRTWVLSDHGNNNAYVNNLGNKDCLEWTVDRVLNFMDTYDIDLYREDFNIAPGPFWTIGDGYEGKDRTGITENLYVQGHYALWDKILERAAQQGKPTWVDSCASGGNRNDLETLKRSIPINRSDSDRFTSTLRLAITPKLNRWLPYNGAVAKDGTSLVDNTCDMYALRASYLCVYEPAANFWCDRDTIDWDSYRRGLAEWKEINKYLLKDFYTLTPFQSTSDDKSWTAYMYWDEKSDSGVVQAFRKPKCDIGEIAVKLKGLDPDREYSVRDIDGKQSIAKVKGRALMKGMRIKATDPRTAVILYIEPVK